MEEFSGRGELRRMQREQERERRRIRDRQRRQSMTQEQRERHLARRRRNYQLRRQRAANAHLPYTSFPQFQPPESSAGEASTSDELQGLPSPTFAEYGIFPQVIGFPHHHLNLGQQMLNMGTKLLQGSSVPLETLLCKPANSPKLMRLNHVRGLARNLTHSIVNPPCTRLVASELIPKEHQDVSVGSTVKSLRLNCVKRLARSKNSFYEETAYENDLKFPAGEFSYLLARTS
ncbi:uncharacterized protein LOC106774886 [Vigna radiata var. radiata]|uniref:Uncharacterized protein LOC106774886 n=1 Tax=Vigna radiata var. radiata TaxID=3916 RepID=A0A1S3VGB5_VIGRR|nr:uncharacterized protein LOC106774886 [Vigna radiata var. radiata]